MATIDLEFTKLCNHILTEGREYENKNRGVKRLQIPSYTLRHDMVNGGFPAITSKKMYFKGFIGELIWFLRGDNDVKWLNEQGIKIWNKDAYNWYCRSAKQALETFNLMKQDDKYSTDEILALLSEQNKREQLLVKNSDNTARLLTDVEFYARGTGSVGQNYSVQWRNFNGHTDQITNLINEMRADIMSSRLKVNAWNPSEVNETALPPCHSEFQIVGVPLTFDQRIRIFSSLLLVDELDDNVDMIINDCRIGREPKAYWDQKLIDCSVPEFGFELHWNQRSVDVFLGLPFNIASYGLLAMILEYLTGYPALAIEGTLKCVHFYDNQYDQARELIKRDTSKHENCKIIIQNDGLNASHTIYDSERLNAILNDLEINDFKVEGYTSEPELKADLLAPKE